MLTQKFISTLIFISLFSSLSYSQNRFPGWDIFTSMKDVRGVSMSGNKVWVASTGGMFSFDINNTSSIESFKTLDGLLSNELTAIIVDNNGNVWSGSLDGAIHQYNPSSKIFRVSNDIQTSEETSKKINKMYQYSNSMFIATEFSVIKFNANTFQFVDQPYINLGSFAPPTAVYGIVVFQDTVWAATKKGIAYANINSYLPIASNWHNFDSNNSPMLIDKTNDAAVFDGLVYFATDSGMVRYAGGTLQLYLPLYNGNPVIEPITHLAVSGNSLYFSTISNNIYRVDQSNITIANLVTSGITVNSLSTSQTGDLLIGTSGKGLNIFRNNTNNFVVPNGPNSNSFAYIEVDNNQNIWATTGALNEGVSRLTDNIWKTFTTETHPWIRGNDLRHIYPSKYSNTVWIGGFGNGMLKVEGDSLFNFNDNNSCLTYFQDQGFVLVEGIGEDSRGKLWVINRAAQNGLTILNFTDCAGFPTPTNPAENTLINLAIDNYNTLWMTFPNDLPNSIRGIAYFNPDVNSGRIINATVLGQDVTTVNDVIVDKNGEVWFGTDNGVIIVNNPYQVVANPNSIPDFYKMRIIENGLSTPLTENVRVLRSDALNKKWLGTKSNGLLYVSPDGSTLENRFTVNNSVLPSNEIIAMAVDKKSGKVYFGSGKGMVSYKTIAVEPLTDCDKIKVGPSPYIIPNNYLLRIDGLVEESSVKILTLSGAIVKEFVSPGGRVANWDGTDKYGNLVSSGIYIIVGYNKDGTKACTGKVAVVRK